jgi:hypothetical protein
MHFSLRQLRFLFKEELLSKENRYARESSSKKKSRVAVA